MAHLLLFFIHPIPATITISSSLDETSIIFLFCINRFLLFGGRKGHVAVLDCLRTVVGAELQLSEEIHDVHYLHNETMFAVAQNKYTYIYDHKGVEVHCMRRHERPYKLDFLPYHYLLTTVGHSGWLKWHDVSTGEYVTGYQTGFGPCKVLKHNPVNAVSHLGHSNGVVSLWSPAVGTTRTILTSICHVFRCILHAFRP